MKKLIIGIIALAALCSCEPKTQKRTPTHDGANLLVREFEYNGHTYIEFARHMIGYDNYTGFVHSPDCPCHKKAEHETD